MTGFGAIRAAASVLIAALCLTAQTSRDAYLDAYRTWRQTDPGIESDAGTAGASLAPRTAQVAELAAAYSAAHSAALRHLADDAGQEVQALKQSVAALPDLAPAPDAIRFANREIAAASSSAATVANDPDPAIQRLRAAFQREQAALENLKTAVVDRQQSETNAVKALTALEQARTSAATELTLLSSALGQATTLMNEEAAGWASYYPKLAAAAEGAPSSALVSATGPTPAAVPPVAELPPAASKPSITPLPLTRYVGVWSYHMGDPFHGPEPELMDVTVHEENGRATGSLYGRFKPAGNGPAGNGAAEIIVRFEFAGDFRNTRDQSFRIQSADGSSVGKIELHPGGPFNVLEVNFEIQDRDGKIQAGDVLLLKQ